MNRHRTKLLLAALAISPSLASAQWSTAVLSEARGAMGATSLEGVAIFAGGSRSGGVNVVPTDRVDLLDIHTGAWTQSTLSVGRAYIGATSVGHLALFAGGSLDTDTPSDAVDIYDVTTGTWSTAQLSVARTNMGAATAGRWAVFAGGSDTLSGTGASNAVDVFDSITGAWSTATLPRTTTYVKAAALGDRVVILEDNGVSPLMLFDPATGVTVDLPRPAEIGTQQVIQLATTKGRIWLVGGANFMFPFSMRALVYDMDLATWEEVPLSEARIGMGVVATSGTLIAAGGLVGVGQLFGVDTVDLFDLQTGATESAVLSEPRYLPASIEVDGRIVLAGGFGSGGVGSFAMDAVDIYDDTAGSSFCSPAVPNSTGAPAEIRLVGGPGTLADGAVSLVATHLPEGSAGYFLASLTQDFVPNAGGSQGTLCLGGSVGRYAATPFFTGFEGRALQDVSLANLPAPMGSAAALPGETWFFQAWYRDANPTGTTNFTAGVSLLIH